MLFSFEWAGTGVQRNTKVEPGLNHLDETGTMGSKNLAVMMSAMMLVRSIDQEDPAILLRTRVGFGMYIVITSVVYYIVHRRILARNDRSALEVTVPKPPFGAGSEDPPQKRMTTVIEYDLELLKKSRQGWIFNTMLLTAIHYKMQTVSPLIMSGLMSFMRLVTDDQLVQLHLLGAAAVGKLKRPFPAEENPLAGLLKGMLPKPEDMNNNNKPEEELKDDGDDTEDEDDLPPPSLQERELDAKLDEDGEDEDDLDESEPKKTK